MPTTKQPQMEPIPGYRLIEPLGSGGFGEVWKCEAPGGLFKAIKFVAGNLHSLHEGRSDPRAGELRAIQRVKDIRHPFLLSMERVEECGGELLIVTELADRSLEDLLEEYRAAGRPGVPRDELLEYLAEAAEVLDLLNLEYALQHLDVKPRNLFLVRGHVKVADFGLVQSLADFQPDAEVGARAVYLSAVTPLYAAPELFTGAVSPNCDQYSLAIVYMEMLTGRLPFAGKNAQQLMRKHALEQPALEALPASDRPLVARALAKEPRQRFDSCADLVHALMGVTASALPERVRARRSAAGRACGAAKDTQTFAPASTTLPLVPAGAKLLPGYELQTCVGCDALAESWEALTPERKRCLVKFLQTDGEREAILHLEALRHPALPPLTAVPGGPGCLVLISGLIEGNLWDHFRAWQRRGERGIPRGELLGYLYSAAEALDQLYQKHGLQHLGLTPSRVLLDGRRVLLADFGLAQLLWLPAGAELGEVGAGLPRPYCAPELAQRMITRSCDQFSLAVMYQELLTGKRPFDARSGEPAPDLLPLPPADRPVVARALDPDPQRRFLSCLDFVRALAGGPRTARRAVAPSEARKRQPESGKKARTLVSQLLAEATTRGGVAEVREVSANGSANGEGALQGRFLAVLPPEGALRKFEAFRQEWGAKLVESGEAWALFEVNRRARSWLRWREGPGLLVGVRWTTPEQARRKLPEVTVTVRPSPDAGPEGAELLREAGPQVLESLRTYLFGNPERRNEQRVPWPHPVVLAYASGKGHRETVKCQGKDLSPAGMGLYVPSSLPTSRVQLRVTGARRDKAAVLIANVVRIQRLADRLFEVGVLFE